MQEVVSLQYEEALIPDQGRLLNVLSSLFTLTQRVMPLDLGNHSSNLDDATLGKTISTDVGTDLAYISK